MTSLFTSKPWSHLELQIKATVFDCFLTFLNILSYSVYIKTKKKKEEKKYHCGVSVIYNYSLLLYYRAGVKPSFCTAALSCLFCALQVTKRPRQQKRRNIQENRTVTNCFSKVQSPARSRSPKSVSESRISPSCQKVFMSCLNLTSVSCTLEMNPSQLRIKSSERCRSQIVPLRGALTKEAFAANGKANLETIHALFCFYSLNGFQRLVIFERVPFENLFFSLAKHQRWKNTRAHVWISVHFPGLISHAVCWNANYHP